MVNHGRVRVCAPVRVRAHVRTRMTRIVVGTV